MSLLWLAVFFFLRYSFQKENYAPEGSITFFMYPFSSFTIVHSGVIDQENCTMNCCSYLIWYLSKYILTYLWTWNLAKNYIFLYLLLYYNLLLVFCLLFLFIILNLCLLLCYSHNIIDLLILCTNLGSRRYEIIVWICSWIFL